MPHPTQPFTPFIATQFPISKLSKESYKERTAKQGQALTGLGKWWGRKPLVMVRATLLGLLLPATDDPQRDRELFLQLMCMDRDGLWQRKNKAIPPATVYHCLQPDERTRTFYPVEGGTRPQYRREMTRLQREALQRLVFERMSYDERLEYCETAERTNGPNDPRTWATINARLGTNAHSLPALLAELGMRQFGHIPWVGDAFCGGGSIPFEAARMGCYAYGSDLNPVAALLTWGALHIVGGGSDLAANITAAQQHIYAAVDKHLCDWGIEHNEAGWRADTFLYCTETVCPECGWRVPLAPSWIVSKSHNAVAVFDPQLEQQAYAIRIVSNVAAEEMKAAEQRSTVKNSTLHCPQCGIQTPMAMLRGDGRAGKGSYGLRMWEADDIVPRPDDVFQERLYCIRWIETYTDANGTTRTRRHYRAPDAADLAREARADALLRERFADWQQKGYIPRRAIAPGDKTDELIRTRGWTCWHHLHTPRQLLTVGLLLATLDRFDCTATVKAAALLGIGRSADYNSKLSRWHTRTIGDKTEQTFSNQALNTLYNYGARSLCALESAWTLSLRLVQPIETLQHITASDARQVSHTCDIWITDPPYADAINYHELTEFFLAWYEGTLPSLFPDWYTDSKRALAIQGTDHGFRTSMVEAYRNLAAHMPNNGYQVVMFTHQDANVWADLTLILWAAGLRVIAAWSIATETESALKQGNYVQGTVLLVLQKQTANDTAFLDEIRPQVKREVQHQLEAMFALEDNEDPNFGDADYQLAAYAAALRVLTGYGGIGDIDVAHELAKQRRRGEESPITRIINDAVRIASDYLIPSGLDRMTWRLLGAEERFYLKGLEIESHGETRAGAYQELARGFGVKDYRDLLASSKANEVRLKTATGFGTRHLEGSEFAGSLVRHALFAVREVARTKHVNDGRMWLHNQLADYWEQRKTLIELLAYLERFGYTNLTHWHADAEAAHWLRGALENDHTGTFH